MGVAAVAKEPEPWIDLAYLGLGLHPEPPFEFELDDGSAVAKGQALHFHDRATGAVYTYHSPELAKRGVCVIRVAGISHYPGAQTSRVNLGSQLALRAEPENPYDRNAVAVWDDDGHQVGHVPATECKRIGDRLARGERVCGMVICDAKAAGRRLLIDAALFPLPAPTPSVPANWYPDPGDPKQWRWWDGGQWTSTTAPRR